MPRGQRPSFASFRRSLGRLALWVLLGSALLSVSARADAGPVGAFAPGGSKPPEARADSPRVEEQIAPDSPRAALTDFTLLTRKGDYAKAARYLDLSAVDQADGSDLAKHLREVLDRHLWLDPDKLSGDPHGNTADGLTPDREDLGNVPGAAGKPEAVVLVRHVDGAGARWVFSSGTVERIDVWYAHLENRWLLDHLPKTLLGFGPHELRWWQWLALGPLLVLGWLVGFAITRLSRLVIRHLTSARGAEIARQLRGPATLGWMIAACYALLPRLGLYEPAEAFVGRGLSAALLLAFFWALWKAVELSQHTVSSAHWARDSLTAHSLLMFGARVGKFVVAALAFVAVLAELGYPVTSIITGLGIGGVALALAAQKTVENLFGAFSLAVDRPFREGDLIRVDTITGTVETIGLRSTRIRTPDRTLVTIPNGKLADMRIETISARDRIRFYCMLAVAHSATEQMSQILTGIEGLLGSEAATMKDTVSVRFVGINDSALNIEVYALLDTTDYGEFLELQQVLLLAMVRVVEQTGHKLAHPTRSIELVQSGLAELNRPGTPT